MRINMSLCSVKSCLGLQVLNRHRRRPKKRNSDDPSGVLRIKTAHVSDQSDASAANMSLAKTTRKPNSVRLLLSADYFTNSDAYCVITRTHDGTILAKTETLHDTNNPKWAALLLSYDKIGRNGRMQLEVHGWNQISEDELIGTCTFDIYTIKPYETRELLVEGGGSMTPTTSITPTTPGSVTRGTAPKALTGMLVEGQCMDHVNYILKIGLTFPFTPQIDRCLAK